MATKKNEFFPDEVFHPGETLSETLSEMGMSYKEFALRCGLSEKTINEIVKGKASISPETSMKFEQVLGIPAYFWITRQSEYDQYIARLRKNELLSQSIEWAKKFPIAKMVEKGWIEKCKTWEEKTNALLSFFSFASDKAWEDYYCSQELRTAFRISLKQVKDPYSVSAWLRKGDIDIKETKIAKEYNKKTLESLLPKMRDIMLEQPEDFFKQLHDVCFDAGVILIHTPCLTNAPISGATRWFGDIPLIQISCRFKRNDNFWFTFFHELGHIILHGKKDVFLEFENGENKYDYSKEHEANEFAKEMTFSKELENKFLIDYEITHDDIISFANKYRVHPSLIVGRLQHKDIIKYNQFRDLIVHIDI